MDKLTIFRILFIVILNAMASTEDKCRSLQERLNLFPDPPAETAQKIKISSLQELLNKLYENYEEESIASQFKMKEMLGLVKKLEAAAKEQSEALQVKEEMNRMKVCRAEKNATKALEKVVKERKETEKKVNTSLESCLIELTSAKTRSLSNCKFAIREFSNVQTSINSLEAAIQAEETTTQQINKKIFAQYSSQMQELADIMAQQRKQKQAEQAKIVDKLQKMYMKIHGLVQESKRQRQQNEEELVNFLEKVIQKVRREMMRQ